MDSIIECRICERSYDGSQHFGVEICRACAAFFRRSVDNKKPFVCKGVRKCTLNLPRKEACQWCRYEKCLRIGITPSMVLNKPRNVVRKRKISPTIATVEHHPDPVPSTSTSTSTFDPSMTTLSPADLLISLPSPPFPSTLLDLRSKIPSWTPMTKWSESTPETSLLKRVVANYRKLCQIKLDYELTVPDIGETQFVAMGRKITIVTLDRLAKLMEASGGFVERFVADSFPEVADYHSEHSGRVLSTFITDMWEMENCYWTYRLLPFEPRSRKLVTSQSTIIDLERTDLLFDPNVPRTPEMAAGIRDMIVLLAGQELATTLRAMHALEISEIEFAALMTITFWSNANHYEKEDTERVAEARLDTVFHELQTMYACELSATDPLKRLGELMLIHADIQLNTTLVRENVVLQTILQSFTKGNYISCLIK